MAGSRLTIRIWSVSGLTRTLESLNELIAANRAHRTAHRAASGAGRDHEEPDGPFST